eukprot:gene14693-biopygen14201
MFAARRWECPETFVGKLDYSLISSVSFARLERARAAARFARRRRNSMATCHRWVSVWTASPGNMVRSPPQRHLPTCKHGVSTGAPWTVRQRERCDTVGSS